MAQVPVTVFSHQLNKQLVKHVRPPTKKSLGKHVRRLKPIVTTREVVDDQLSVARGLPPLSEVSILKDKTTKELVPTIESASGLRMKVKLQQPKHVRAFWRLQDRAPKKGWGAAKLIFKKAMGRTAKMVAMAAGPAVVSARLPTGKSAQLVFPTLSVKHNVVTMDENADVTFGVTMYPPWMRQRLRAEIFTAFVEMGQRRLPVDPELYEVVRQKLANPALCGQYVSTRPPLPPPLPSPPPNTPSRKRKEVASPKTAAKAKKVKPAPVVGEVARFVREEGA